MSLFDENIFGGGVFERTKFCFVYCGDDRCDCGAKYIPILYPCAMPEPEPESKPYVEVVPDQE